MKTLLALMVLTTALLVACTSPDRPVPPPITDLPEADCDKPGRTGPDGRPLPPC